MKARVAFLSHILPPSPSGQSVALYRILSGICEDQYYLIHSRPEEKHEAGQHFHLEAQYYSLPAERELSWPKHFRLIPIRNRLNLFWKIYVRAKNVAAVVRKEPATTALVACTGDFTDIPAGWLASKMLRIPFYGYIFDDYVFQWTGSLRQIAKRMASILFRSSAGVIGPNELICEEYRERYGVNATLVRNPCAGDEFNAEWYSQWPAEEGRIKILYSGAIYHANYDCFRNLVQAMDLLHEYPIELHIFTAQTREELRSQGIESNRLFIHSHVPYDEILEQQRKADILFLPLAFVSPIPQVIRTSAPGKLGEYLASGRPVLAHVPADCFVAFYLKKYQTGIVADQNDPNKLALEIKKLITNSADYDQMIQNARQRAQSDFSPRLAQEQLTQLLGI